MNVKKVTADEARDILNRIYSGGVPFSVGHVAGMISSGSREAYADDKGLVVVAGGTHMCYYYGDVAGVVDYLVRLFKEELSCTLWLGEDENDVAYNRQLTAAGFTRYIEGCDNYVRMGYASTVADELYRLAHNVGLAPTREECVAAIRKELPGLVLKL